MQTSRCGWRRVGVGVAVVGFLPCCLLTSNFDGLTGGKDLLDGGPDGSGGAAVSSSSASSSSSAASSSSASSSSGSGGFPSTPVLDDFNRADGAVGGQWLVENAGAYSIGGNQLSVSTGSPGVIIWPTVFGPTQEAFITFQATDPSDGEHELILKSQGGVVQECESLQVDYQYPMLELHRCTGGNFSDIGTGVMVYFLPGDQLGARAYPDGTVEAYKNGMLIKTWDATSWPFYSQGGRIGWASYGVVAPARHDDFGGG